MKRMIIAASYIPEDFDIMEALEQAKQDLKTYGGSAGNIRYNQNGAVYVDGDDEEMLGASIDYMEKQLEKMPESWFNELPNDPVLITDIMTEDKLYWGL